MIIKSSNKYNIIFIGKHLTQKSIKILENNCFTDEEDLILESFNGRLARNIELAIRRKENNKYEKRF